MEELGQEKNIIIFNRARQKAYNSFYRTLKQLYGKNNITEKDFLNKWYENLTKEINIIADGWYNPPPKGMAVLFGSRISFDSLRNEENWSNNTMIDWKEDLLYAYCSPIDKITGIIGDISLTLYFGKDEIIKKHIKNCHKAVMKVFSQLNNVKNSQELFRCSEQIFFEHNLKNCIISKTDKVSLDLGHTFPQLKFKQDKDILTPKEKQDISQSRKFINENSKWEFTEGIQFTIEPQLISTENLKLPQISQHYLVKKEKDRFIICTDIDKILQEYQLID